LATKQLGGKVSAATIVRGAWYALQQEGRLLHSAVAVFATGDASTALALAMLAREELGKANMLRDLAWRVQVRGTQGTVREVTDCM
jgi:AbiV family abortive infection protein